MICLPYLVIKRMTRHTQLLQEKTHLCVVRDEQDPLSCLNEAGKLACISPEERACTDASFFF